MIDIEHICSHPASLSLHLTSQVLVTNPFMNPLARSIEFQWLIYINYLEANRDLGIIFTPWPCWAACGILAPGPEIEPRSWQWEHGVLTTGLPGTWEPNFKVRSWSHNKLYNLCRRNSRNKINKYWRLRFLSQSGNMEGVKLVPMLSPVCKGSLVITLQGIRGRP